MSLNEERMMILKMLQDGKINSDEAARLLEALDGGGRQPQGEAPHHRYGRQQPNYYDEVAKFRERIHEWKRDFSKHHNPKDFERMVDDFSNKAEKIGKNVAAVSFGIADKIIDYVGSIVDTGAFNIFGSCNAVEKSFEAEAREGMDLELEGINGQISVKKHQENNILIKTKIRSPQEDTENILLFTNDGNKVALKLGKTEFISVSHEVYLPAVKFNKIRLETRNSKISAEDSLSEEFESITKNASIDLMGVTSGKVRLDTKNAKVMANYVTGKDIAINTKNSVIDIKNIKAEKISAVTANGRITVENVQNYENTPDIAMDLRTRNADIKVNMNDMDNKGYKVKAQTTNGGINLLIPELLYHTPNRQGVPGKYAEAESSNYSNYPQRVNIYAETANGYIEVVR